MSTYTKERRGGGGGVTVVAPHGVLTVGALWTLGSILQALVHI